MTTNEYNVEQATKVLRAALVLLGDSVEPAGFPKVREPSTEPMMAERAGIDFDVAINVYGHDFDIDVEGTLVSIERDIECETEWVMEMDHLENLTGAQLRRLAHWALWLIQQRDEMELLTTKTVVND